MSERILTGERGRFKKDYRHVGDQSREILVAGHGRHLAFDDAAVPLPSRSDDVMVAVGFSPRKASPKYPRVA